MSKREKH